MLRINEGLINGESSFQISDEDDGDYRIVEIHPWSRGRDRSVYISVGTYENEDGDSPEDFEDGDNYWNIIVNREDFVEGILQTFPELKRADDLP